MRQILMVLIIISLVVITGFVIYDGVGCKVVKASQPKVGQPTIAPVPTKEKFVPIPQVPDQVRKTVEGSGCQCNGGAIRVQGVYRDYHCAHCTHWNTTVKAVVVRPVLQRRTCNHGCSVVDKKVQVDKCHHGLFRDWNYQRKVEVKVTRTVN